MTGFLVLVALVVALVIAIVLVVRRRNAPGGRSGVHPEDQERSPRVQ